MRNEPESPAPIGTSAVTTSRVRREALALLVSWRVVLGVAVLAVAVVGVTR